MNYSLSGVFSSNLGKKVLYRNLILYKYTYSFKLITKKFICCNNTEISLHFLLQMKDYKNSSHFTKGRVKFVKNLWGPQHQDVTVTLNDLGYTMIA